MDTTLLTGSNPVVTRELRVLLRNSRTFALLALYVSILGSIVMAQFSSGGGQSFSTETVRANMGRPLFITFFLAQVVMVLMMVPGLATGALAQEREQRTLEPLLLTPMTPLGVVWGKAAGVLALAGLLLLATLPLTSLCWVLGGVSPEELLGAYATLLALALFTTGLGIYSAAKWPNTTQATVMCYAQLPILLGIVGLFFAPGFIVSGLMVLLWIFQRFALLWKAFGSRRLPAKLLPAWNLILWPVEGALGLGLLYVTWAHYEIGAMVVGVCFVASYLVMVAFFILREAAREVAQKPLSIAPKRERIEDFKEEWRRAVALENVPAPAPIGPYSYSSISQANAPFAAVGVADAPLPGQPRPMAPPAPATQRSKATYGIEPFLSDKLNPVFAKDMRTGLLGKKDYFFRVAYVATIGSELLMLAFMLLDPLGSTTRFTEGWAQLHLALLMTAGALFGARSLAPEREQQTLPQLLTVPMTAGAVIGGKMMAVLAYTSYVFLTGLPLIILLPALGELPWVTAFGFLILELACGAFAAAWGLFWSISSMTVRRALGWSLSGVLALVLGGWFVNLAGVNDRAEFANDTLGWLMASVRDTILPMPAMSGVFRTMATTSYGVAPLPATLPGEFFITLFCYSATAALLMLLTAKVFKDYAKSS